MSDPYSPSRTRIYLNAPPFMRKMGCGLGCAGGVIAIAIGGGVLGLLVLGWKTLLNL